MRRPEQTTPSTSAQDTAHSHWSTSFIHRGSLLARGASRKAAKSFTLPHRGLPRRLKKLPHCAGACSAGRLLSGVKSQTNAASYQPEP
jgi:hypothetical protein